MRDVTMREIVMNRIQSNWNIGLDEFNMWNIKTFQKCGMTGYITHGGEEYRQGNDISDVLDACTDGELLAMYDGQACQEHR